MPFVLGVIGVALAVLYFVLRANSTVKAVKELDRDTKGLQHRVKGAVHNIVGTPLRRVRDPRLAAAILMIQLVRTGSPVTASEKTKILELLVDPLHVKDSYAMFELAWSYTQPRAFFSNYADELLPLLADKLTIEERGQLISMLRDVATSYGDASELQVGAINRLEKRLIRA